MKKIALLFTMTVLTAGIVAAPRLPGNVEEWKVATHYRGPNLTLTLFHQGMPQLSLKNNVRLGGIVLSQRGRNFSGKLTREADRTHSYTFPDLPGVTLRFELNTDNFFTGQLSVAGEIVPPPLTFSLLRPELESGKLIIDGAEQPFPAERQEFKNLRQITFHAGEPAQAFSLQVGEGTIAVLRISPSKYGVTVELRPEKAGGNVDFTIVPGVPR